MPPDLFWEVSFREYRAMMKGASNRLKREQNQRAWHAWHVAALGRMDPKKFPRLKDMTGDTQQRRMTPQELEAATRHWLANARNRKA